MDVMVHSEGRSRRRHPALSEAGARSRLVDDHMFEIRHPNGRRRGSCRLQVFTAPELRAVAVATWVPGDGCSLPNCAERFASEAWRRHLPHDNRPPVWIQRQNLDPDHGDTYGVNVVTFETTGRFELTSPSWIPITDEDLAELVGTQVDLDRGQGVEPPSEPISRVLYGTRWVVMLPRPTPFREPDCMPGAGSSLARRLGRQLVPRRAKRDCCWYHGGDWARVSRIAIRLVREASASDVPEDEIDTFVTARAQAEGVAGWELDALDSLVDPTVGIFVEQDGARLVYVNGQHRAQAMLDAGVRRTLTVEYGEETPT
jgi:hypothetical protein